MHNYYSMANLLKVLITTHDLEKTKLKNDSIVTTRVKVKLSF